MKRIALLLFFVIFLSSCGNSGIKTNENLFCDFLDNDIYVSAKDKDISFIFSEDDILITSPEILKGTKLVFKDDNVFAFIKGYETKVPKSCLSSVKALYDGIQKIKNSEKDTMNFKNNSAIFENLSMRLSEDEIHAESVGREFIIKKRIENGTNNSRGKP